MGVGMIVEKIVMKNIWLILENVMKEDEGNKEKVWYVEK